MSGDRVGARKKKAAKSQPRARAVAGLEGYILRAGYNLDRADYLDGDLAPEDDAYRRFGVKRGHAVHLWFDNEDEAQGFHDTALGMVLRYVKRKTRRRKPK